MKIEQFTNADLNLFVDKKLDSKKVEQIYEAILSDATLRMHIYEIMLVHELVDYAYNNISTLRKK